MSELFRSFNLDAEPGLFLELMQAADLEAVGKGRQGAVLTLPDEQRGFPLVRTTSRYASPAQCWSATHGRLAEEVSSLASIENTFNNVLFEHYTNAYAKMGFHSDQALDLQPDTHIAILSTYATRPEAGTERKLVVEPKGSGDSFELVMGHNSVIVFSVDVNRHFRHKIVLDKSSNPPENEWLGLTFRTSNTLVTYSSEGVVLSDGTELTLGSDEEAREFFQLRGRENREPGFDYPPCTFTISPSDLMVPVVSK